MSRAARHGLGGTVIAVVLLFASGGLSKSEAALEQLPEKGFGLASHER